MYCNFCVDPYPGCTHIHAHAHTRHTLRHRDTETQTDRRAHPASIGDGSARARQNAVTWLSLNAWWMFSTGWSIRLAWICSGRAQGCPSGGSPGEGPGCRAEELRGEALLLSRHSAQALVRADLKWMLKDAYRLGWHRTQNLKDSGFDPQCLTLHPGSPISH